MARKRITVDRRGGRGSVTVIADVCGTCGERCFDPEAMGLIEG